MKHLHALIACNQYIFANSKSKPHPFHDKSTWQQPPQPPVALESYLESTKYDIASITFSSVRDNLSTRQRQALKTLRTNSEVTPKKADKGTTTVIMDTKQKTQDGLQYSKSLTRIPTNLLLDLIHNKYKRSFHKRAY